MEKTLKQVLPHFNFNYQGRTFKTVPTDCKRCRMQVILTAAAKQRAHLRLLPAHLLYHRFAAVKKEDGVGCSV